MGTSACLLSPFLVRFLILHAGVLFSLFAFALFDDFLVREEVNDHFNIRMPSIPGASVQLTPRHGRGVSTLKDFANWYILLSHV